MLVLVKSSVREERLIMDFVVGHIFMISSSGTMFIIDYVKYFQWIQMEFLQQKELAIFSFAYHIQKLSKQYRRLKHCSIMSHMQHPAHINSPNNFSFDAQRNKKRFVILRCLLTYYATHNRYIGKRFLLSCCLNFL